MPPGHFGQFFEMVEVALFTVKVMNVYVLAKNGLVYKCTVWAIPSETHLVKLQK
jgi:hypothetical protein